MYLVLGLGCGRENMLKFWLFFYIVLSPLQSQERKQRDKSRSHVTRSVFKSCSCLFREIQQDLVTKPPPLISWSQVALNLIISYSLTMTFHRWDSNCDSTNRRLMDIKIKKKKKGTAYCKEYLVVSLSHVQLFCDRLLSVLFPKQEYWSGFLLPSPEDLPDAGIELWSPALPANSLPLSHQSREDNGSPLQYSCLENPMDGRTW